MNGYPVIIRPDGGGEIIELGTIGIICQSIDNTNQVIKGLGNYKFDGCSAEVVRSTSHLHEHSKLCIEREKAIYRALPKDPNVLDCISITEAGIILPYMRLGDLRNYLSQHHGSIGMDLRTQWIETAAKAVSFIHHHEIIHADISARNFLVADDLSIKLCDFSGSGMGDQSPLVAEEDRYQMSPELQRSVTTDIFAFGCLVFEIMTGSRPYDKMKDEDLEEVHRLYAAARYPCLDGVQFGEIVHKCWTSQYRDMDELQSDLQSER